MSTSIYLTIDFGSTYTKLTAIDLDKGEIVATSRAMTTVKTDVLVGFNEAFEELKSCLFLSSRWFKNNCHRFSSRINNRSS